MSSLMMKYFSLCNSIPFLLDTYVCENNYKGYGGHCYLYINNAFTWVQGEKYCQDQGGSLVEIQSYGEQVYVEGMSCLEIFLPGLVCF